MSWTIEREKKLRELWKKGHSASQIANILGETTRNAVIGKAHRLKLAARVTSRISNVKNKEIKRNLDRLNLNTKNKLQISKEVKT